jgi:hypothetical protein
MRASAAFLCVLWLSGCGSPAANEAAPAEPNAAAAEAPGAAPKADQVLKSETVEAVFSGWEIGDYVWANLKVAGREAEGAFVGPAPIEHFLEAHKGRAIRVKIDTVRMMLEAAGSEQEVRKIADASVGGVSASAWWAGLSAGEKAAAEARMEEVLGGGV